MITEFSMRRPLRAVADVDPAMDLEIGAMVNVGRADAIGATLLFGGEESTGRHGFGLRYRRWLTYHVGAELGVAWISVCETTGPSTCERDRSGFSAQGALNLSDWFGLTVGFEHINAGANRPGDFVSWSYPAASQWSAGMKVGSYATPAVVLGLGALIAATW